MRSFDMQQGFIITAVIVVIGIGVIAGVFFFLQRRSTPTEQSNDVTKIPPNTR